MQRTEGGKESREGIRKKREPVRRKKKKVGRCGQSHLSSASNKNPSLRVCRSSAAQTKRQKNQHLSGCLLLYRSLFYRLLFVSSHFFGQNAQHEKSCVSKRGHVFFEGRFKLIRFLFESGETSVAGSFSSLPVKKQTSLFQGIFGRLFFYSPNNIIAKVFQS